MPNAQRIRAVRRLLLQRIATDTHPRGERDAPEVAGDASLVEVLDLRRAYDAALRERDVEAVAQIRAKARELLAAEATDGEARP